MLPSIGQKIRSLPRNLSFVRDIEYFEGPILSEYRSDNESGVYLEKWCTREEGVERSLLVRSDLRSIALYMANRLSMLSLLSENSDGVCFLIDRMLEGQKVIETVTLATLDELPPSYMPRADAYHDESLRPLWDRTLQSFLLGRDWSGEQIVAIERAYLDVAAFNYFAAVNSEPDVVVPARILKYNYRRGFPVGSAFKVMRAALPTDVRGKSVGVSAHSPGVLSIDVSTTIATNIIESTRQLESAKPLYDLVQSWVKQDMSDDPALPDDAATHLEWFADAMNLQLDRFGDPIRPHVVGKLLTAYFRKLLKLVRPPGEAEFLGVDTSLFLTDVFVGEDEDD